MENLDLTTLVVSAERLQNLLEKLNIEFCFIGGLAVQFWGESRFTSDIDIFVWTDFGNESVVIDELLRYLKPRVAGAKEFALTNRVLLAKEDQGVDIDIALAALPFEREMLERAKKIRIRNTDLVVCQPSDLIVLKAFANRTRDWEDIRGIIIRSGNQLQWDRTLREVEMLASLKEEPEIATQLMTLRKTLATKDSNTP